MTTEVFSTTYIPRGRTPLRPKRSPSTLKEAAGLSATYSSTDYDEEIEDGLELKESIERYRDVSSQTFTRLEDIDL